MKIVEKITRLGRSHCCVCTGGVCAHIGPVLLCRDHYEKPLQRAHHTTDPADPRLGHGVDEQPIPQHDVYLILSDAERAKGFVRPVRRSYRHSVCGAVTTMSLPLAETYARDPHFYGATYCVRCGMHKAVGEFVWDDGSGQKVGS